MVHRSWCKGNQLCGIEHCSGLVKYSDILRSSEAFPSDAPCFPSVPPLWAISDVRFLFGLQSLILAVRLHETKHWYLLQLWDVRILARHREKGGHKCPFSRVESLNLFFLLFFSRNTMRNLKPQQFTISRRCLNQLKYQWNHHAKMPRSKRQFFIASE